jgi:hypothetical protein
MRRLSQPPGVFPGDGNVDSNIWEGYIMGRLLEHSGIHRIDIQIHEHSALQYYIDRSLHYTITPDHDYKRSPTAERRKKSLPLTAKIIYEITKLWVQLTHCITYRDDFQMSD